MQLVGRYQIEARIGEGAMADVYRARDPSIGRVLAIKVLKPDFRSNPEIVARFLREARAAGALSHPNIVTIYDVGEADGFPYIAMELLEGVPLDEFIRDAGRMPPKAAIRIGTQIARALDFAHGAGVIHRDIKPSNVMLCEGGRSAKILDFGIARVGEADRVRAELNALRTQVGQVLGTPRYMSPEQALGLEIDRRSDLFSLGVVLYEMLTGKTAFDGTSIATLALQITQQQPEPIGKALPSCPKGLQYVVEKLLAKKPEKRFATGGQVAEALKREYEAMGNTAHKSRRLSVQFRLTMVMAAATGFALLLSILAVLDRQYQTMETMALTSGDAITSFVANNVALRAVENAGLPPSQQDWLPVQAFVASASADSGVRQILVVDARGIVRGSSDPARIGTRYGAAPAEELLSQSGDQRITATAGHDFRVRRTIRYAGQAFGQVDLVMSSASLSAAASSSRNLLIGLGAALLLVVTAISFTIASLAARPLHQLKRALRDAAAGKRHFRISHKRHDEFGELFDSFNRLADSIEGEKDKLDATYAGPAPSVEATRIDLSPAPAPAFSASDLRKRIA